MQGDLATVVNQKTDIKSGVELRSKLLNTLQYIQGKLSYSEYIDLVMQSVKGKAIQKLYGPKGVEAKFIRGHQSIIFAIRSRNLGEPQGMTVIEFYLAIEKLKDDTSKRPLQRRRNNRPRNK